jgi:hypothetical protein
MAVLANQDRMLLSEDLPTGPVVQGRQRSEQYIGYT